METPATCTGNVEGECLGTDLRKEELKKWKILQGVPDFVLEQVKIAAVTSECAFLVTMDDSVFVVGHNSYGMLGFDGLNIRDIPGSQPKRHDFLSRIGVTEFAIGAGFALALTKSGEVYSMGNNSEGQLGVGHRDRVVGPKKVFGLEGHRIVKIRCGSHHSVCITSEGLIFGWGPSSFGKVGPHAILGVTSPKLVEFPEVVDISSVACTQSSTIAWTKDGKVYGWGSNGNEELGEPSQLGASIPKEIKFPDGVKVTKVVCGATHCVALATDRSMFAWGRDFSSDIDNLSVVNHPPFRLTWMPDRVVDVESNWRCRSTACRTYSGVYAFGDFKLRKLLMPTKIEYDSLEEAFADDSCSMYETWHASQRKAARSRSRVRADPVSHDEQYSPLAYRSYDQTKHVIEFSVQGKIVRGWEPTLAKCRVLKEQIMQTKCLDGRGPVEIKQFGFAQFRAFIGYLHMDSLEIDNNHLSELVALAHHYEEKELRRIGLMRIGNLIKIDNAIDTYSTALQYEDLELQLSALTFIASEFWQIMQHPKFVSQEPHPSIGQRIITALQQMNLLSTPLKEKIQEDERKETEVKLPESKRQSTIDTLTVVQLEEVIHPIDNTSDSWV